MNPSNAEITLGALKQLDAPIKLKVQLSYNHLLFELKKVIAEHGPVAILGLEYLSDQIRDIERFEPKHLLNLPFEPLELL